jgi:ankyrin repeat protein
VKSIWTTLQIDPTSDTKAIRQAYAKQLQLKNPEIDPTGFQVLRTAYEEALGKAAANKSPKTQDVNSPVQAESPRSIVIGMPKAHDSVAQNAEPPTSNRISGMPKAPEVHDEVKQAPPDAFLLAAGMVDRLSSCREEAEMLNLFRQWREEGAFNHVGVSLHFQTELLKEFSGQPKLHARLFAAAYSLFSWGELLQKPSHPHVKILSRLIKQNHLSDILSLLEKTAGQPFFQSVAIDDVGSAAKYLQSNPQILHETDDEGNNALHIACEAGAIACAEFLARQGIALDEGNSSGQTPLNLAVDANSPQLVEILCKAGADINHADGEGLTPLYLAVIHSQDDIIECLCGFPNLECRPDVLCAAVASGRPELVRYFLDLGWEASPEGVTEPPLITAARLNLMEILNDLLDAGADTSQTNKRGKTALQIAAERGFLEIVERLLQYDLEDNAVINAANQAITHGHFKIVERILDALELTTPMKIINFRGIKSSMHSHGFASCLDDLFLSLEALDYTKPLTAETLPP